MTRICSVPGCGNRYVVGGDLKFHRFPKEKKLLDDWVHLLKIRTKPTTWMFVCSDHFTERDYIVTSLGAFKILKPESIPYRNLPRFNSIDRTDPFKKLRKQIFRDRINKAEAKHKKKEELSEVPIKKAVKVYSCRRLLAHPSQEVVIASTNIQAGETDIVLPLSSSIDTQTNMNEVHYSESSVQVNPTIVKKTTQTPAFTERLKVSNLTDADIQYLTGLDKVRFNILFRLLEEFNPLSDRPCMSKQDMLYVTLYKYRHNLDYKMIATVTRFNRVDVSDVFKEVTLKLFHVFAQIDIWNLSYKSPILYITIVDCTENPVERSTNPSLHQLTFSYYKNRPTFKVLVGCDEMGAVNFISQAFGGSISDREIFIVSKIIDKLQPGQAIMADRGFEVSDLLEEKGVTLNIPPFLKRKTLNRTQFSETEVLYTRAVANRRIIIEQLNGRAKQNRILVDVMTTDLWPYANKIIFNCFSLINFYKPIKQYFFQ